MTIFFIIIKYTNILNQVPNQNVTWKTDWFFSLTGGIYTVKISEQSMFRSEYIKKINSNVDTHPTDPQVTDPCVTSYNMLTMNIKINELFS